MFSDKCLCFRCGADLTSRFLRGRPVPADQSLSPGGDGAKTYRVVCAVCGAVNLVRLQAAGRGTK